jgi:hypothetical protein
MASSVHKLVGAGAHVEDYDMIDEKPDVAIITPAESPEEPEAEPAADDCKSAFHGLYGGFH